MSKPRALTAAQTIVSLALAIALVGGGYLVCTAPPLSPALSSALAWDDLSPFSKDQLSRVAAAARDFSFGSHDRTALYRTIYQVNRELEGNRSSGLSNAAQPSGFPDLDGLSEQSDGAAFASAFASARDAYVFDRSAVEHLDDVNRVATATLPILAICILVGAGGLFALARVAGRRAAAVPLIASSTLVVGLFAVLGLWAAIDFMGMFSAFHGIFFTQGTWEFSESSLLICALPTELWMALGAIWLTVSLLACSATGLIGVRLLREKTRASL